MSRVREYATFHEFLSGGDERSNGDGWSLALARRPAARMTVTRGKSEAKWKVEQKGMEKKTEVITEGRTGRQGFGAVLSGPSAIDFAVINRSGYSIQIERRYSRLTV